jgi:hypothetical protein
LTAVPFADLSGTVGRREHGDPTPREPAAAWLGINNRGPMIASGIYQGIVRDRVVADALLQFP